MLVRIRSLDRLRNDRPVLDDARGRTQRGSGVGRDRRIAARSRRTTSGSLARNSHGTSTSADASFVTAAEAPEAVTEAAVAERHELRDPDRHRAAERRGHHRVPVRIRDFPGGHPRSLGAVFVATRRYRRRRTRVGLRSPASPPESPTTTASWPRTRAAPPTARRSPSRPGQPTIQGEGGLEELTGGHGQPGPGLPTLASRQAFGERPRKPRGPRASAPPGRAPAPGPSACRR